jgi:hypothetical protein
VETGDLGSGGDPLKAKIEETAQRVFGGSGSRPTGRGQPADHGGGGADGDGGESWVVVGFSIEQGEEIVSGSARRADGSLCTRTELLERIEEELPGLLKLAREHQVAEAVALLSG